MTTKHRPWWLFAMQMSLLDTTIKEDHQPDKKRYIIAGKPVIKNLSWIVYGPVFAVLAVLLVGVLSWALAINRQDATLKLIFVCFLALSPALAWGVMGAVMNKLSQRYLDAEVDAKKQRVELELDMTTRALQKDNELPVSFDDIEDFKLVADSGVYYTPGENSVTIVNLIANTRQGKVTLLPKQLGSLRQKLQLLSQLEAAVQTSNK